MENHLNHPVSSSQRGWLDKGNIQLCLDGVNLTFFVRIHRGALGQGEWRPCWDGRNPGFAYDTGGDEIHVVSFEVADPPKLYFRSEKREAIKFLQLPEGEIIKTGEENG